VNRECLCLNSYELFTRRLYTIPDLSHLHDGHSGLLVEASHPAHALAGSMRLKLLHELYMIASWAMHLAAM
jgi:hypothetical protein